MGAWLWVRVVNGELGGGLVERMEMIAALFLDQLWLGGSI